MVQPQWRTVWRFLLKLKVGVPIVAQQKQMWLKCAGAVVQAGGCSSDLAPRLGASICHRCSPKKTTKTKKKKNTLKIELPCDPAIPRLGVYVDKTIIQERYLHPNVHCSIFTIAKTRKHPKCPWTQEWIKTWYLHAMEYY